VGRIRIAAKETTHWRFYRPPNSNNDYWSLLEESIDRAYSIHSNNIIVTGDFNINILHSHQNKMSLLISSFNSVQLITEPTHYTEHSSSWIDIAFTNRPELVVASVTSDPFIPALIHFHCPIVIVIKFTISCMYMYVIRGVA